MALKEDLTPGQSVAQRFTLTRKLAAPPHVAVWLARDEDREADALLRIGAHWPEPDAEVRDALTRATRIVHPGLMRCLGLFDYRGSAVLAHEFSGDDTLHLDGGGDHGEALRNMMPLIDTLAYLHDLGLVHGALDENMVRVAKGEGIKLDGLGLAWLQQGAMPERRSDIQALGALLTRVTGAGEGVPLPGTLKQAFEAMQSDSGEIRDLHEVRRRIARALDMDEARVTPARVVEASGSGVVKPSGRAISAADVNKREAKPRAGVPAALALPALILVLSAAVYVLFFLPSPQPVESVPQAQRAVSSTPPGGAPAAANSQPQAPFAAAASARLRQAAQDAAMALLRDLVALEDRGVTNWAADEFAAARLAGDEGDALYGQQAFDAALARYQEGVALAKQLIERSGEVLEAAIADGEAALAAGNGDEARRQFALALEIDTDNPVASKGMQRAEQLASVLEKLRLGKSAETAGDWRAARDHYREAVQLDGEYAAAREALARAEGRLAAGRFQDLMTRGFKELDAGNASAARSAFQEAARLRPSAAGPRDALAQVETSLRNRDIASRRAAAEAAERSEDWQTAVAAYRSILDTDGTLVFAREGLERAERRAQLAERMQLYINEPLRMFSNEAYNDARTALAAARQLADRGPVLSRQISELAGHIAAARIPVTVQLRSDGLTRVVIFKLGELGSFKEQAVGLVPGRYTAVGSRTGYRDVRREFEVRPGRPPAPVSIICEEPV